MRITPLCIFEKNRFHLIRCRVYEHKAQCFRLQKYRQFQNLFTNPQKTRFFYSIVWSCVFRSFDIANFLSYVR